MSNEGHCIGADIRSPLVEFDRGTGIETERVAMEGGGRMLKVSGPLMDRYDARPVVVLSFFPGNGSASGVGGFDWVPDGPKAMQWLRKQISWHIQHTCADPADHSSFTFCRIWVPNEIADADEVTDFVESLIEARELPAQDFSELPPRAPDDLETSI